MANLNSIPVLIAGGGPSALYLALSLARNGVPFRIIEKDGHFHRSSRAAGIQPRTLEIQRFLGIDQAILNWGGRSTVPPMAMYKMPGGTEIMKVMQILKPVDPTPARPIGGAATIPQSDHERVIREKLATMGVFVELGKELLSFEQDPDGVTAQLRVYGRDGAADTTESIRTEFLCGADGAKGPTRNLMGCTFLGKTEDGEAIITADMVIHGLDEEKWHSWKSTDKSEGSVSVACRPHMDGKGKFCAGVAVSGMENPHTILEPGVFVKLFKDTVGRSDLELEEPFSITLWRPNIRMVDTFQSGRVFLVGDAAHVHSPAGGQGLNSSVQDAFNLGWKLALVHKRFSPLSLLASYTEERLPVIATMLDTTSTLHLRMKAVIAQDTQSTGKGAEKDKAVFNYAGINQLGVNYRWSSIVSDTRMPHESTEDALLALKAYSYGPREAGSVAAGDRAPDASGLQDVATRAPTRLFDLFDVARHTVLLLAASPAAMDEIARVKAAMETLPSTATRTVLISMDALDPNVFAKAGLRTMADVEGHAFGGYKVVEGDGNEDGDALTIVVVRPDAYIGAIVKTAEEMSGYIAKVFRA